MAQIRSTGWTTPYYAVTGEDGSYQIGEVPPGTLVLWHEGPGRWRDRDGGERQGHRGLLPSQR